MLILFQLRMFGCSPYFFILYSRVLCFVFYFYVSGGYMPHALIQVITASVWWNYLAKRLTVPSLLYTLIFG